MCKKRQVIYDPCRVSLTLAASPHNTTPLGLVFSYASITIEIRPSAFLNDALIRRILYLTLAAALAVHYLSSSSRNFRLEKDF